MERLKLTFQESYLLSFYWHEPVLSMNSLGYSVEEYLKIYSSEDGIGYNVLTSKHNSELDQLERKEITNSLKFYTFHLFQLLSTIDLVANLLNPETTHAILLPVYRLKIIMTYIIYYEGILKEIECAT